jgi:hypothetical protein
MASAAPAADAEALDIDWDFWSAQQEAFEALDSGEFDLVSFRGGYGSGKTVLGSRATIMFAEDVPRSDNLILAQDSKKGGPTTYKKFFEELPGNDTVPDEGGDPENSPLVADYNRNKSRLTMHNGSVIRLGSADKWNRYAGSEFSFIWCDEVAHYETTDLFKLDEMLTSRQRTETGPNVTLWTSTGNGFNDFWQFVELQETPDGDAITTRMHNVVADSRRNPFLHEKEKQVRKFADTAREEEALAGGFSAAEGLVYDRFSRARHVRPAGGDAVQAAAETDWRIYGYDHGWNDPRVVVEIGRTPADVLVALDHFYRSESQPEDVIDPDDGTGWLADKPEGTIYSEHMPEHVAKFRDAGWPATNAIKDIDDGIEHVRGLLKDDGEHGPGLLVSDACGQLIREFLSYQDDDVGGSDTTDHALDSLRYATYTDAYGGTGGITRSTRQGTNTATGSRKRSRDGSVSRRTR